MPYHTFRVSSTEIVHCPASVEICPHDGRRTEHPAHDERWIRCKVPNDDIRPWGRQLYAFLSILFVPVLIDSFWSALFSHHRCQLQHDDDKTYSTYREWWVSGHRNILLLPITFLFVVFLSVIGAFSDVVFMLLTAFIPFRHTFNEWRFPFASRDPTHLIHVWYEEQIFHSYLSKGWNDNEDIWEFNIITDPEYDITVDQHFKMRFPPFVYWCFIRGDSLATGGSPKIRHP